MLENVGDDLDGKVVSISGSGNVAQYATEKATELGAKVVTMSDSSGTIYDPDGINSEKLNWVMDLKNNKRGRISKYAEEFKVKYYDGDRPWGIKCDIALPCATQNEIMDADAKQLVSNGCRVISEGANMPSDPGAISVFRERKCYLVRQGFKRWRSCNQWSGDEPK